METIAMNTAEIFSRFDEVTRQLLQDLQSVDEKNFNKVPFEKSWTAAQLADHLFKSNSSIYQSLEKAGVPAGRDAGLGVPKLKETFLDFSIKFQSPEMIVPKESYYDKKTLLNKLEHSVNDIKTIRAMVEPSGLVEHGALGAITKWEIFHFLVYHTQRHLHQLHNIIKHLNNKTS